MSRILNSFADVVSAKVVYRKKAAFLKLRKAACNKGMVKKFNAKLKKEGKYGCKFVEMKPYNGPQPAKMPKKPKYPSHPHPHAHPHPPHIIAIPPVAKPHVPGRRLRIIKPTRFRLLRPTSRPLKRFKLRQPTKPLRRLPPRRGTPPQ
ncbi:MAG: hypothetical protein EP343_03855 [Deltaproteobacteria bacterium]|nr:MAG: hypothetical protein EP343_03855 [Deltaproteobacteria bacterium]